MTYKIKSKKSKEKSYVIDNSKNWKKVIFDDGSFYYVNKKREGSLHIWDKNVSIEIDTIKIGKRSFPQTHIYEEFKTHSQALKYARDYMRTH